MPVWKYKAKKEFPIEKIPDRGYFLMYHAHAAATNRIMRQYGLVIPPRWPAQPIQVKLVITHSDRKDFAEHGTIEKEFKCPHCYEVETYVFHMRREGEGRSTKIQEVVVKEVSDGN